VYCNEKNKKKNDVEKHPEESPAGYQIPRGSEQDSLAGTKCRQTASRHVILCHPLYINISRQNDKMRTKIKGIIIKTRRKYLIYRRLSSNTSIKRKSVNRDPI